jgi:hypothetical protein
VPEDWRILEPKAGHSHMFTYFKSPGCQNDEHNFSHLRLATANP